MEPRATQPMTGTRLAVVIGTSVAIYATTFAIAKAGYPDRLWVFVVAGLILPWVAIVAALAVAVHNRLLRG